MLRVSFLFASVVIDIAFFCFVCFVVSVVVSMKLVWTALLCCVVDVVVVVVVSDALLFPFEFSSVSVCDSSACFKVVCWVVHGVGSSNVLLG